MSFLSVIIILSSFSFSASTEVKIERLFNSYVKNVSTNKLDNKLYISDFEVILKDDKKIFKLCSKSKCFIATKITKMSHKNNLWKLQAKVSHAGKQIKSRQGCYFIINERNTFKMANYIDECNER